MGQKVNPIAFRMGITAPWRSRWYATKKNFGAWLVEDQKIRGFVKKEYGFAGISRIEIERIGEKLRVIISAARPGLLIGKKGAKVDKISEDVGLLVGRAVDVDVKDVETPELDAQIVGEAIAEQLKKRAPYRRTMRRYAEMIMDLGAKGVKIQLKGRLGGAEIARCEHIMLGRIPLNTIRGDVDYATATAVTMKGTVGIKTWIYRGERFDTKARAPEAAEARAAAAPLTAPAMQA
ncbi:MAG: 30S ribosomal protein S3 [Planctomycetes bacterium]|nr:30S ribosomal protein S3 [Planctomycetota bacterium]